MRQLRLSQPLALTDKEASEAPMEHDARDKRHEFGEAEVLLANSLGNR